MANQVFITPTAFQTLDRQGNAVETTFGLLVSDDEGGSYSDSLFADRETLLKMSDAEIVEAARSIDDYAADTIAFAEDALEGVHVFGDFIPWTEIKAGSGPKA